MFDNFSLIRISSSDVLRSGPVKTFTREDWALIVLPIFPSCKAGEERNIINYFFSMILIKRILASAPVPSGPLLLSAVSAI